MAAGEPLGQSLLADKLAASLATAGITLRAPLEFRWLRTGSQLSRKKAGPEGPAEVGLESRDAQNWYLSVAFTVRPGSL